MSMHTLEDLLDVMERLRDPQRGCPWDRQQTFQSIVPSTLEESYELADTIERQDYAHLREELGDVLFQVVFYSQLAREDSLFDFAAVVDTLAEKLLRRHPHVFPDGTLVSLRTSQSGDATARDEQQIRQNWEMIKEQERHARAQTGLLDDVPIALPAMSRAAKLQKRAANVGFDWDAWSSVAEKIREELQEVEQAVAEGNEDDLQAELGDLLFACVNLARHFKQDPEQCLRKSNRKFENRFRYIEEQLQQEGQSPAQVDAQRMNLLWDEAKQRGL